RGGELGRRRRAQPPRPELRRRPARTQAAARRHARPGGALRRRSGRGRGAALSLSGAALVLFSGGQDSTTCLAWALERHERVETLGFDYGQRHRIELAQRGVLRDALGAIKPQWAERLGADHVLDLSALGAISDTALTSDK